MNANRSKNLSTVGEILTKRSKWVEAITDTAIAVCINFPLNVTLLWICMSLELKVLTTSIIMTSIFTIIAILRKVVIRSIFEKYEKR